MKMSCWSGSLRTKQPRVFDNPDEFDPEGNKDKNLVYGAGPHVCPGRTLSTLELRAALNAMLEGGPVELAGEAVRETPPVGGYKAVPLRKRP